MFPFRKNSEKLSESYPQNSVQYQFTPTNEIHPSLKCDSITGNKLKISRNITKQHQKYLTQMMTDISWHGKQKGRMISKNGNAKEYKLGAKI